MTETRALSIDRKAKTVLVQRKDGSQSTLPYDKLVLGTGSTPRRLPIPGIDLDNVFTVSTLGEAIRIKEQVAGGGVGSAVIVGGGFIGWKWPRPSPTCGASKPRSSRSPTRSCPAS
jgi:NADPH-dependent 2,4-dienoyl-CoA reductase/sulfur reductase-like enzyme